MRFRYSCLNLAQHELNNLPYAPLFLFRGENSVEALGLVDTGAMMNVLPYQIGLRLGGIWDDRQASLQVGGSFNSQVAIPFFCMSKVGNMRAVRMSFAWVKSNNVPLLLGQFDFFMKFDVCFYRSQNEFEVKPIIANA